jgi:atlastin
MPAVQIVSLENDQIVFHDSLLKSILNEVDTSLPVTIVGVAGSFRTGKSLLMNLFLKEAGMIENIGDGFPFASGRKRHTTGLWIWDKVYVKNDRGYLFMDTQGLFDTETNQVVTTKVFALSTLISSFLIFNVSKQLQEDQLQQLAVFSEYAKLMNSPGPFQNLELVVRDWQHETLAGDDYLNEVFGGRVDQELKDTRNSISACFQKIGCTLLPHPGFQVAKESFDLGDLSIEFQEQVSTFVRKIMHKESRTKKINQVGVFTKDLTTVISEYVNLMNHAETFPQIDNILAANSKIMSITTKDRAYDMYLKTVNNTSPISLSELHKIQRKGIKEALEFFDNARQLGPSVYYTRQREVLAAQIETRAELCSKIFQTNGNWKFPVYAGVGCLVGHTVWGSVCNTILPQQVCLPPSLALQAGYTYALMLLILRYLF